jgi:ABC-2 type transport system ATP-binding protein
MAAIRTNGLSKYYGEIRGIEDLTFDVRDGEVFGFLGPNGAGKSTTIRTLMGFQSPTGGSASVLGYDVTDRKAMIEAKRSIGIFPPKWASTRALPETDSFGIRRRSRAIRAAMSC